MASSQARSASSLPAIHEAQRALQRERPVGEPEEKVEGRPLHRLEDVQVERDPVATFSVAVLSVAALGVGPVLIGSLDGSSRYGLQ